MNRNIYIFSSANCRLFKWGLLGPNSPNGALPAYRFWFMDPSCPLRYYNFRPGLWIRMDLMRIRIQFGIQGFDDQK